VHNEKLLEVMGDDATQDQAFARANDVHKNAVGGISDIIHIPGAGEKSTSRTSSP
jgi:cell division protein FtsZ